MVRVSQSVGQSRISDDLLPKNPSRWIFPTIRLPNASDLHEAGSLQIHRCAQNDGEKPLSWYLLFTRPRQERLIADILTKQGLCTYLPMLHAASAPSKNTDIAGAAVFEPMFPRYLFCGLAQEQYVDMIRAASSSITHIIGLDARPLDVASVLDNIRALETQHLEEKLVGASNDEAYRGLKRLTSKIAHERTILLFEMLSKQMTVKLRSQLFDFA